jgi:hypothetical protein
VDNKTVLGKGVALVARLAGAAGVRCLVVAGSVEGDRGELERQLGAAIVDCGEGHRGTPTASEARRRLRERLLSWEG